MWQQQKSALPFDIIEPILSRLPVKSLLRFKTVSKSWNKMISDPVFARTHLDRSKYSNPHNIFLRMSSFGSRCDDELFYMIKLEDDKKRLRTVKLLNGPDERWDKILCYCDGVLLLTDFWYSTFVLWNPSTGTHTMFRSDRGFSGSRYGLCHDPTIGGYKVVIIDSTITDYYYVFSANYRYRMKRKEFDRLDQTGREMNCSQVMNRSGVSVDGVVYFFTRCNNDSDIIYFDPRDDKLKILPKPVGVEGYNWFYLTYLGGCLCLYRTGGEDFTMIELWIKEKGRDNNSWKVLITVENERMLCSSIMDFDALCFVENKVLVQLGLSRLLLYGSCGKKFEEIELEEEFGRYGTISYRDNILVPYIDSLFYPGKRIGGKKKKYGKKTGGKKFGKKNGSKR
ncbi:PREDICTED: F-box protein At5g62510-like [Erythranthe guttata]|uniref:F-box protein At5g62510-like n=1 Tax=Erythranthe guttata TaxID=4155 RepID=UPI00064DCE4E|nr:PREDICTED: F-box protein At5g62510-like [Erythranthe guttata]|eukprot:XP_012832921.1 PREDICTED: F-box protein At5g62510-like [Erythranthe guttata]